MRKLKSFLWNLFVQLFGILLFLSAMPGILLLVIPFILALLFNLIDKQITKTGFTYYNKTLGKYL